VWELLDKLSCNIQSLLLADLVDHYDNHYAQNERLKTVHRTNVCLFIDTQYNKIELN